MTTREDLLKATKDILLENGWEGTSGRAIHQRAKVSHGSWRHAFPGDKAEAAAEIHADYHLQIWARSMETFRRAHPRYFGQTIRHALEQLILSLTADPAATRLYLELDRALLGTQFAAKLNDLHAADHTEASTWLSNSPQGMKAALSGPTAHALIFAPALMLAAQGLSLLSDHTIQIILADGAAAAMEAAVKRSDHTNTISDKADCGNLCAAQLPLLVGVGQSPRRRGKGG
jgi:AcrR family transcriptional regulator